RVIAAAGAAGRSPSHAQPAAAAVSATSHTAVTHAAHGPGVPALSVPPVTILPPSKRMFADSLARAPCAAPSFSSGGWVPWRGGLRGRVRPRYCILTMLYERWRAIASAGGDETALRDLADNRSWTFRQLARAAETTPCPDPEPWCRPRGARAEFILGVLAGWREGRVVVPLDADQAAPEVPPPPRSAVHYKLTS